MKGIGRIGEYRGNSEKPDVFRGANSRSSAVSLAAQWFQEHCCLTIFDEVWLVNEITEKVVDSLRQLFTTVLIEWFMKLRTVEFVQFQRLNSWRRIMAFHRKF